MALLEESGELDARVLRPLASRYLAFISHAFNQTNHRFRNFMSYSRAWLEEVGSEDSQGRTLWALGTVIGRSTDPGRQSLALELFHAARAPVSAFTSPRAWAYTLLGIQEYLRAFDGHREVQELRASLALRLFELHGRTSDTSWPWFEAHLTYANARLSQAMLVSGEALKNDAMTAVGPSSLEWLFTLQTTGAGHFAPVGSNGFFQRGEPMAEFDQQPVEACAMISSCLDAFRVTGEPKWLQRARKTFGWFFGRNHLHQPLYDARSGGCRDALHSDRVNENQGAESTLSFLLSLQEMRLAERASTHRAGVESADAITSPGLDPAPRPSAPLAARAESPQ